MLKKKKRNSNNILANKKNFNAGKPQRCLLILKCTIYDVQYIHIHMNCANNGFEHLDSMQDRFQIIYLKYVIYSNFKSQLNRKVINFSNAGINTIYPLIL